MPDFSEDERIIQLSKEVANNLRIKWQDTLNII